MSQYVYTLSDYEDDGAENMVATLNRRSLPRLLDQFLSYRAANIARGVYFKNLETILSENDADNLGMNELAPGWWGTIQLHIVELTDFEHTIAPNN